VSDEQVNDFTSTFKLIETQSEEYWNSLTKKQQLDAFCAVSRRIYQGEILDKGTYRHVLYQVFEFGKESYAQAQMSGYLTIHNSIVSEDHDWQLLLKFAEKYGIENADEKIKEFLF
jgi:hypothetical protein